MNFSLASRFAAFANWQLKELKPLERIRWWLLWDQQTSSSATYWTIIMLFDSILIWNENKEVEVCEFKKGKQVGVLYEKIPQQTQKHFSWRKISVFLSHNSEAFLERLLCRNFVMIFRLLSLSFVIKFVLFFFLFCIILNFASENKNFCAGCKSLATEEKKKLPLSNSKAACKRQKSFLCVCDKAKRWTGGKT